MDGFWQSPLTQGLLVPFLAGFAGAILAGFAARRFGPSAARVFPPAPAAALGFLAAYVLLEGVVWPAVSAKQKVFWLAAAAAVLGWALAAVRARRGLVLAVAFGAPLAALVWLDWRRLAAGLPLHVALTWAVLYGLSVAVLLGLASAGRDGAGSGGDRRGPDGDGQGAGPGAPLLLLAAAFGAPLLLLAAAFGAAAISAYGAFVGMGQASAALGAALLGYAAAALLIRPTAGGPPPFGAFGASGAVGLGGAWLCCVYVMVLFAPDVSRIALAVLFLAFPAAWLVRRRAVRAGRPAPLVLSGLAVGIPAAAGAAYAIVTAAPGVMQ